MTEANEDKWGGFRWRVRIQSRFAPLYPAFDADVWYPVVAECGPEALLIQVGGEERFIRRQHVRVMHDRRTTVRAN